MILGRIDENVFTRDEVDFLMQMANQLALAVENALAYREIANLKDKLTQEKVYLEDEIRGEMSFDEIVGKSVALRTLLQQVEVVAPTDSTVLIYGETGTGKELIARAIHDLSPRRQSAFVKLNCAAIPAGLLESELFGHEKGAFTGAVAQRIGRFEIGSRGTVFLDEVGEIPLELQPKLLRVLQEREFERLGSSRTLQTGARLIAATNQDLAAMVEQQKFRSDLFYRLNVFPVQVPPLRERQRRYSAIGSPFRKTIRPKDEQSHRHHTLGSHDRANPLSLAGQHPGVAEPDGTRRHSIARPSAESPASRSANPSAHTKDRNPGRRRAETHHRRTGSHQLGRRRTERSSQAPGNEAHHPPVENRQTKNPPSLKHNTVLQKTTRTQQPPPPSAVGQVANLRPIANRPSEPANIPAPCPNPGSLSP